MIRIYGAFSGGRHDLDIALERVPALLAEPGTTIWVVLDGPSVEDVERVGRIFRFHPLAVEDCAKSIELPKIDEFEDHAFLVTHGLRLDDEGRIEKIEVDCFIGRNYLVSSCDVSSPSVAAVRERVERNPETLARGADFLLHSILDQQADNYMPLVDGVDREIDRLEEEVLERPREALLAEILRLRRQIVDIRRSIGPQREVIGRLARHDLDFVSPKCTIYFRDVYDHVVRVHEMLEDLRDVINGLTESYRSMISQRLNEVMQKLTTISTIFLPMTFVASIFGMNFDYMPELHWRLGYFYAVGIMIAVGGGFYVFFRSRHWI